MESTDPSQEPALTLSGTVEPGVEAGCHLLRTGGTTYQLIWDRNELVDGQQVEVVGAVAEDLMTICQQGTPFVIERLVRVPERTP